jgi:hypothetical protein
MLYHTPSKKAIQNNILSEEIRFIRETHTLKFDNKGKRKRRFGQ